MAAEARGKTPNELKERGNEVSLAYPKAYAMKKYDAAEFFWSLAFGGADRELTKQVACY